MPVRFLFVANSQGRTRLSRYEDDGCRETGDGGARTWRTPEERAALEREIAKRVVGRREHLSSILYFESLTIVYRRYASLYFIVSADGDENEFAILEFIQVFVETLNAYFDFVREIDILFHPEKVHLILDEMIVNGRICGTCNNKATVLAPILAADGGSRRSTYTTKNAGTIALLGQASNDDDDEIE